MIGLICVDSRCLQVLGFQNTVGRSDAADDSRFNTVGFIRWYQIVTTRCETRQRMHKAASLSIKCVSRGRRKEIVDGSAALPRRKRSAPTMRNGTEHIFIRQIPRHVSTMAILEYQLSKSLFTAEKTHTHKHTVHMTRE